MVVVHTYYRHTVDRQAVDRQAGKQTQACTETNSRTHVQTQACTQTNTHPHTHARTHTHTYIRRAAVTLGCRASGQLAPQVGRKKVLLVVDVRFVIVIYNWNALKHVKGGFLFLEGIKLKANKSKVGFEPRRPFYLSLETYALYRQEGTW